MIRLLFIIVLFSRRADTETPKTGDVAVMSATKQRIELQVSARVDVTNLEIKQVLNLYENYINSQPDSVYNNPYWNNKEKKQYADFDFSRASIYNGVTSDQLFKSYVPFVLSVEPKNEKYEIRVLYSNAATEPPYVGSKVWCIHKLNAVKEDASWRLENLFIDVTKNWIRKQVGFVEYVFPPSHQFNAERANRAILFCKEVINRFNRQFEDSFSFYLASDLDEMGELESFDYIFSGGTTGKAREGMILSSKGDEFYPHEFIHKLLPKNESRGHVIEEGLATFLGTKNDLDKYSSMMQKLAIDHEQRDSYSLENILNNRVEWNGYPVAYPAGALICEVIHDAHGDEGIISLASQRTQDFNEIMSVTERILGLSRVEVNQLIEKKMKEFE